MTAVEPHIQPQKLVQELALGDTWSSNPLVWRNFVDYVIVCHELEHKGHVETLAAVISELGKWNLVLTENSVQGDPQDLLVWMMSYA
jgi:hypothetical protein